MTLFVEHINLQQFSTPTSVENYCIFMFEGSGVFTVDATPYTYNGYTLLFLSPFSIFSGKKQALQLPNSCNFTAISIV